MGKTLVRIRASLKQSARRSKLTPARTRQLLRQGRIAPEQVHQDAEPLLALKARTMKVVLR